MTFIDAQYKFAIQVQNKISARRMQKLDQPIKSSSIKLHVSSEISYIHKLYNSPDINWIPTNTLWWLFVPSSWDSSSGNQCGPRTTGLRRTIRCGKSMSRVSWTMMVLLCQHTEVCSAGVNHSAIYYNQTYTVPCCIARNRKPDRYATDY